MPPKQINKETAEKETQQQLVTQQQDETQPQQNRPRFCFCCTFPLFVLIISMFLPFVLPISALLFEIHYPEFHSPLRLSGRVNPATGELLTKTNQANLRFVNDFCNFDRLHCCNGSVPLKFPKSLPEIQEIVKEQYFELKTIIEKYPGTGKKIPSPLIRVVGGGHAINNLVCSSQDSEYPPRNRVILSLDEFTNWRGGIQINVIKKNPNPKTEEEKWEQDRNPRRVSATAWAPAGLRLKQLNEQLWEKGFSLFNTGMIQEQSVAGVIATAVHGTGLQNTAINEHVVSIDIVLANGTLARFSKAKHPAIFKHARMHLGLFGVVVGVEFQVRNRFYVRRMEQLGNEDHVVNAVLSDQNHIKEKIVLSDLGQPMLMRSQVWWFQNSQQSLVQDMTDEFTAEEVETDPEFSAYLRNRYVVQIEKIVTDFFYLVMTTISVHLPSFTPLIHKLAVLNHGFERHYLARSYESFTAPGINYHSVRYSETELFVPVDKARAAWEAYKEFLSENTVSSFSLPLNSLFNKKRTGASSSSSSSPTFCNINSLSPIRTVAPDTIPLSPMSGNQNLVAFSFTLVYRDSWPDCSRMFQKKLAQFGARPHWGKWFSPMLKNKADVEEMYGKENVDSFGQAVLEVDPLGLFRPMLMNTLFF